MSCSSFCFLVTCTGLLQWEESVGGSGSHAQSTHWVPLPAHQLQQIQRPVGRHSMMHTRNAHTWTHINGCTCVTSISSYPSWVSLAFQICACDGWQRPRERVTIKVRLQLTPHLISQINITQEHLSQMIYLFFYLKIWSLNLYKWSTCCYIIFVVAI